ncbi:chemotaxis protein CheA [Fulvimarina endophytica]|uniref:Chemotaxis protein CheA n=1 Tax=Fulvimarina endophytica TaxID=2293836 RepID=A0A371X840_9HYPH|nr:chemotaxis protein CheA [Fulvimarina endophytica]RFC65368.1 chemotaxis protein CheA [Fulvimarina endophytica]
MTGMEEIRQTFFEECAEQLDELETGLLAIQDGSADSETVNAVFRAVHSVKGGAGAFNLDTLVGFAHTFESVLDLVRSDRLETSEQVVSVLLRSSDVLADLVTAARDETAHNAAAVAEVSMALEALLGDTSSGSGSSAEDELDGLMGDFGFEPVQVSLDDLIGPQGDNRFRILFKPNRDLYARANESMVLIREVLSLGSGEVVCDMSRLPDLDALDSEEAYLSWGITLETNASRGAIEEIFEFVDEECELTIEDLNETEDEPASEDVDREVSELLAMLSAGASDGSNSDDDETDFDFASVGMGIETDPEPEEDFDEPGFAAPAAIETKHEPVAAPAARKPVEAEAGPKDAGEAGDDKKAGAPPSTTIRVDLERVDRLIDLVGELVIHQVMLSQSAQKAGINSSSEVILGFEDLEMLTRQIQDSVMAIRAQAVKSVFQKLPRLVREVCAATGKDVRLTTEGEYTEVDKTVIERLSDPLTHMIRNAIDHGIESPEDRIKAGKPPVGNICVSAAHRSGRIVIEISDDGAGIDRQRVRAIAVNKGLIPAGANLSDDEIDNLIFLPGFSTREKASELSGRGVGMDVVKRSIQALGGRVSISSQLGKGSTFVLSLPLTLAVLDGMIVSTGDNTLVLPLTAVLETLKPNSGDIREVLDGASVIRVRERFIPVIDVARQLGFTTTPSDAREGVIVLVESETGAGQALLFDAIQGQRQVVIKSLEANYGRIEGVSAATILGDGRVALILDVDALTTSNRLDAPSYNPFSVAAE